MKTRTSTWYECKIRYEKMMEDGMLKKVTETYTVEALSFTETEANIIKEMSAYISGEFEVRDIKKAAYGEVFFSDSPCSDDNWYKCKVQFITIDEKSGVEKKTNTFILVQATDFRNAVENFTKGMADTMADYEIVSIAETPLMDVYRAKLTLDNK